MGLYFCPLSGANGNLSKRGKIYTTKTNGLCGKITVLPKSKYYEKMKSFYKETSEGTGWFIVPDEDFEYEYLSICKIEHSKLFSDAMEICLDAHNGQVDKGGHPYIEHPITLAISARQQYPDDEIYSCVALLHDTMEDTDFVNTQYLREHGMPQKVIDAVNCMTHRKGDSYDEYIEHLKDNKYSRRVKILDLMNNMDVSRLNEIITDKDVERLRKYQKYYFMLKKYDKDKNE